MALRSRTIRACIALAALALVAAACGDDDDASSSTTPESAATGATTAGSDAGSAAAAAGTVVVVDSDLGQILAADGRTLYTFAPDNGGAPTCYDECATMWPPLTTTAVAVAAGLDAGIFGTVARTDGSMQVTVDGWPLYFYADDTAPGDVNGQGVGGVWYVVGPDGSTIDDDAAAVPGGY